MLSQLTHPTITHNNYRFVEVIAEGIKNMAMDSSADVRAFGKGAYQALSNNWPEVAQTYAHIYYTDER